MVPSDKTKYSIPPPSESGDDQNSINKENQWLIDIRQIMADVDAEKRYYETPVSIFRVPKSIVDEKPEAYTPQLIAFGPYYHCDPDFYEMDVYKLATVKKIFNLTEFENLIKMIIDDKLAEKICKCYSGLTTPQNYRFIAWIMAIDVFFLLDLLVTFTDNNGAGDQIRVQSTSGVTQPNVYAVIRDVLKLENQIPILAFRVILEEAFRNDDFVVLFYTKPHELLYDALLKFCSEISPFKLNCDTTPPSQVFRHRHLLDLLYHFITFNGNLCDSYAKIPSSKQETEQEEEKFNYSKSETINCGLLSKVLERLKGLNIGNSLKKVCSLTIKLLELVHIPLAFLDDKKVLIHSVSQLCRAGMTFCPIDGGTANVRFETNSMTFYLPVFTLKRTSDVIMRNLVAYETLAMSKTNKSLNFKRYTELMSAIVDTTEDVQLLKEAKVLVVQNEHANSNASIVEMFNGMTKTMESKDAVIDEAIRKANICYYNTTRIKAYRMMKQNIYSSWKFLTFLTSLLLLLLTALQTVCSVYSCPSLFNTVKTT